MTWLRGVLLLCVLRMCAILTAPFGRTHAHFWSQVASIAQISRLKGWDSEAILRGLGGYSRAVLGVKGAILETENVFSSFGAKYVEHHQEFQALADKLR